MQARILQIYLIRSKQAPLAKCNNGRMVTQAVILHSKNRGVASTQGISIWEMLETKCILSMVRSVKLNQAMWFCWDVAVARLSQEEQVSLHSTE